MYDCVRESITQRAYLSQHVRMHACGVRFWLAAIRTTDTACWSSGMIDLFACWHTDCRHRRSKYAHLRSAQN
jgi:hypothetical protein